MATVGPTPGGPSALALLEFYFSDANLRHDRLIQKQMAEHGGSVPVALLLRCNRLRALGASAHDVENAADASSHLVLAPDRQSVSRAVPFQPKEERYYLERTVYVEGLPPDATHDSVQALFQQCGEVTYVQLPKHREDDTLKGFAFVEFAEVEQARQAVARLSPALAIPFTTWGSVRELVDLMNAASVARPALRVLPKAEWLRLHRQYKAAQDKLAALISRANPSEKMVVKTSGVIAKLEGVHFDDERLKVVLEGANPPQAIASAVESPAGMTAEELPPVGSSDNAAQSSTSTSTTTEVASGEAAAVPAEAAQSQPPAKSSSRVLRLTRAEHKRQLLEMFREHGVIFVDHSVQPPPESKEGGPAAPARDVFHLRFGTHDGAVQARSSALERKLVESFLLLEGEEEIQYWARIAEQRLSRRAARPPKRPRTDRKTKKWAWASDANGGRPGRKRARKPGPEAQAPGGATALNGAAEAEPAAGPAYHFSRKGAPQRKAGQRTVPAAARQHMTFDSDEEEMADTCPVPPAHKTLPAADGAIDASSSDSESDTSSDTDSASTSSDSSDDAAPLAPAPPPPAPEEPRTEPQSLAEGPGGPPSSEP
eukprot:EG_transcript_5392